jgi:hypothetical protein
MDLKKKFKDTKAKIKHYAPEIAAFGVVVTLAAAAIYAIKKDLSEGIEGTLVFIPQPSEESDKTERGTVFKVTGEDRDRIIGDTTFDLYGITDVDDFYYLTNDPSDD